MQLDYTGPINEYGDDIVRLYDFGMKEAILFQQLLEKTLLIEKQELKLSSVDFIELRNCDLIFRICDTDEGIRTNNNIHFFCDMTIEGYQKMIKILAPYCKRETKGYQYLYDVDSLTDLLFSPGGTW
jgi:hypothetical protein